jgi:hypothetical protein
MATDSRGRELTSYWVRRSLRVALQVVRGVDLQSMLASERVARPIDLSATHPILRTREPPRDGRLDVLLSAPSLVRRPRDDGQRALARRKEERGP